MAVAVITVASPYLARPTRRVGQGIVLLLAIATMYLGRSLPADVVAAIVLGWGIAALVHFIFGTAARRPTSEQVTRALTALDVPADGVRAADEQPLARAVFLADGKAGPLRVIAIGRDEADAQLLAPRLALDRVPRRAADSVPDPPTAGRVRGVHDVAGRARRARVCRTSLVAGTSGPLALLVSAEVAG